MRMFVLVCKCMSTCVHTCVCVFVHVYPCLCVRVCVRACVCLWSYLGKPRPLDEVVELPERGVPGEGLDVLEQVLLLSLKQLPVVGDQQRVGPERPDVDADHLQREGDTQRE